MASNQLSVVSVNFTVGQGLLKIGYTRVGDFGISHSVYSKRGELLEFGHFLEALVSDLGFTQVKLCELLKLGYFL